jgi:hypothetical protein
MQREAAEQARRCRRAQTRGQRLQGGVEPVTP